MNPQHLHSHQEVPNQTKALPLSYKVSSTGISSTYSIFNTRYFDTSCCATSMINPWEWGLQIGDSRMK